jgi:branched-chain amino acid transport system permease protein
VPERWLSGPTGTFIMGVLLIVLTFFLPGGIVSGVRRLKARVIRVIPVPPKGFKPSGSTGNDEPVSTTVDDNDLAPQT